MGKLSFAVIGVLAGFHPSSAHALKRGSSGQVLEEISYRPVGKLIYLPVRINRGRLRWFCLDSGAPESVIDRSAAKDAGIATAGAGTIKGTGTGPVEADFAPPLRLTIGRLNTTIERPRIIDLSVVPVPVRQAGLVGAEVFDKYVVRIDPDRHRIAFIDPNAFHAPRKAASLPLELTNHRLYLNLYLEPRPGMGAVRRIRIDTGSEDSVDDDSVKKSAIVKETRLGNGLGDSYVGYSGVYSRVRVGRYVFKHVWGPAGAVPIIGMELMRRFTLTFDGRNGRLYLEPNRHLNEPVPAPE